MDDSDVELKPGESVWCQLQSPEPGGYLVTLTPSGIEGFLPSEDPIQIGRVVPATFVCMNGERALLTYAFVLGTTARVQVSTASVQENAFSVWADSYPDMNRVRRAVDIVMPPLSGSAMMLKLDPEKAPGFLGSIESSAFTGCIKAFCETRRSRAAILFHEGRAVGSVYTTKVVLDPYSFEKGLKKTVDDLLAADADLEMYELPPGMVLSMSSLFLGYLDHRDISLDNKQYVAKMLEYFSKSKATACFSVIHESESPLALGFVWDGNFLGAYSIADQKFSEEKSFLNQLIEGQAEPGLQVYILPPAMTTDSVLFGYSLSSEQFTGDYD
jgi:hypothetical protein